MTARAGGRYASPAGRGIIRYPWGARPHRPSAGGCSTPVGQVGVVVPAGVAVRLTARSVVAAGTRVLAAENSPRIRAATDLGNTPMARAFGRAGYVNFQRTINMTWTVPYI